MFARVAVPEQRLREMLRANTADLVLRTTAAGVVTGVCKACHEVVDGAEKGGLLWFRCPMCRRLTFNAIANVYRDAHFAAQDGKPFEYEIFYVKSLPPELRPPFNEN
jgi:hypothetical protein